MKLLVIFLTICTFLLVACDSRSDNENKDNDSVLKQNSDNDNDRKKNDRDD